MINIKSFIYKILLSILLVLIILILSKSSSSFKSKLYDNVYNSNISFGYLNNLYTNYLGKIIPFDLVDTKPVFSETLKYKEATKYHDGCALKVDTNYLVPSINYGLVVFIGEKENYGKTIIIEQEDGIEVWYSNLDNISVSLYDYIESGTYLGTTIDNKLYLVFKNNGEILNYEEYIN